MRPRLLITLLTLLALPAWASGERAAFVARHYVGTPYQLGGATPTGFDCSGLVQFAYSQTGVTLPRTVARQWASAVPVERSELREGDLLFFRLRGGQRLHVGIYLGDGRFVHAPSRGKQVTYADFHNPYWNSHFTGAGRIATRR